jgi:hypothetical protein
MFEQGDHEAVDKAAYALQRVARQSDEPQWQTVRAQRLVAFYETTSEERLLEGERQIIDQALAAGRQVIFLIPGDRPHLSWLNNTLNLKLLRAADIPSGTSNRNFSRGEKWGIYQATVR